MQVRKMKLSEVIDVIRVQKEYWLFPSFFYFLVRGIIRGTAYVCVEENKISGIAIWSGRRLGVITVSKKAQGMGVGSLLLEQTEPKNPWAITIGDDKVINFYKKNGYTVTDVKDGKVKLEKLES